MSISVSKVSVGAAIGPDSTASGLRTVEVLTVMTPPSVEVSARAVEVSTVMMPAAPAGGGAALRRTHALISG